MLIKKNYSKLKKAKKYFSVIINTIASLGGALTTAVSISVLLGPGSIIGYLVGAIMATCGLATNLISFYINISESEESHNRSLKFEDKNLLLINSFISLAVLVLAISAISSGIFAYMGFIALSSMLALPVPLITYQITASISAVAVILSSLVFNEVYIYKITEKLFANSSHDDNKTSIETSVNFSNNTATQSVDFNDTQIKKPLLSPSHETRQNSTVTTNNEFKFN